MIELKTIRKEKGYTQKDVADALGCSLPTYINWELGKQKIPELKLPAIIKIMKRMRKKK